MIAVGILSNEICKSPDVAFNAGGLGGLRGLSGTVSVDVDSVESLVVESGVVTLGERLLLLLLPSSENDTGVKLRIGIADTICLKGVVNDIPPRPPIPVSNETTGGLKYGIWRALSTKRLWMLSSRFEISNHTKQSKHDRLALAPAA